MKLLLQRVKQASIAVGGEEIASIGAGLLILAGFGVEDGLDLPGRKSWSSLLKKVLDLRIFPNSEGKLDMSVQDYGDGGGDILLASQFTLYADCRKGRRPSFHLAAAPGVAESLFAKLAQDFESLRPGRVRSGRFGADMDVSLANWGPVTIMLTDDHLAESRRPRKQTA